jgi:hypothetical protein
MMKSQKRLFPTPDRAKRSARSVFLSLAALVAISGMLGGCIVETPGHDHGGWWWHHHD